MLRGAFAAGVTPLRDAGGAVDEGAVAPIVDFLAAGGIDGVLVAGTTGEGVLLSVPERRRVARRFLDTAEGRVAVVVHCAAQTTADTVALDADAAEAGAAAVVVIAPPCFAGPKALIHRAIEQGAVKLVLRLRGVPVEPDLRRPLRPLDDAERAELEGRFAEILETTGHERE